MTCQHKYIRFVFTEGSHITDYYYNKIVMVNKYINIKLQNNF